MANDSLQQNTTSNFEFFSLSYCIAWMTVYGVEAVAIVILNVLTIIIYLKARGLRKRSLYLVINLAVADMLAPLTATYWILRLGNNCHFWTTNLFKRNEINFAYEVLFHLPPTVSVTNLAVISLERMHATYRPFNHRFIEKKIFGAAVAAVWLTPGLLTAILWPLLQLDISWHHLYAAYYLFLLCCLFIILVSYTSIAAKFYCATPRQHHGAIGRERKLTKTLFCATVASLILILPFIILWFISCFGSHDSLHQTWLHLYNFLFCLCFANSLINPVLYAFQIPEFKRVLFSLVRCRSRSGRVQVFPLNDM